MSDDSRPKCAICGAYHDNPQFARGYPGMVCGRCDGKAKMVDGSEPQFSSFGDFGDNPVYIEDAKCWRCYAGGGWVTVRDLHDCDSLEEVNSKQLRGDK
jgi:hypothetical protein